MAGEAKSAAESLASLGSAITSPAKLAFVGYVILTATGKIVTATGQFLIITLVFLVLQVFHDDYLRIRLNECAKLQADKVRRAQLPGSSADG